MTVSLVQLLALSERRAWSVYKIKYVILNWDRRVRSKNDGGGVHTVSYHQLLDLYNVHPFEVKIVKNYTELRCGFDFIAECLILDTHYKSEQYDIKNCVRIKDRFNKRNLWRYECVSYEWIFKMQKWPNIFCWKIYKITVEIRKISTIKFKEI